MSVDMFGLDEFGNPGGISPFWGALIGPGLQSGAAIAWRAATDMDKWAEAVGAAVGAVAGGVLMIFESTRGAGTVALAGALATGVPRQVEQLLSKTESLKDQIAAVIKASGKTEAEQKAILAQLTTVGLGGSGLGMQAIQYLQGRGLGMTTLEMQNQSLRGAPGVVAGQGALGQNVAAQQLKALGGPGVSGLGARYGATVFGQ